MRHYDRKRPLVAIHIPKTGGVSFRQVLEQWFGRRLYRHYYDERRGRMPRKHRLTRLFSGEFKEGICVYGHFNRQRGLGVDAYYPEVDQFITILREPFEQVVSGYFYRAKVAPNWKDPSRTPTEDLESYLEHASPNMLGQLPFDLTLENYRTLLEEHFVHVGITEEMSTSVRIIGEKLGFAAPAQLETLNRTARPRDVPYERRTSFMQRHPLEYAIYEFARERHDKLA